MLGVGTFILYSQRQILNMTILCMVNHKSITDNSENWINSSEAIRSCKSNQLNYSDEDSFEIKVTSKNIFVYLGHEVGFQGDFQGPWF